MGAIAGGGLALALHGVESALVLPAMLVAGAIGGLAWAAIPAWLRTRFNANEILTSLMLVYVAPLVLSLLVHDAWRDPEGFNFPQSKMFTDSALLPNLLEGTRLNAGFLFALAVVAAGWLFMQKSYVGYQMRVAGLAPGGGELRRHLVAAHRLARHADRRRVRRARRRERGRRADRAAPALGVARLRLRGDHRRVRRQAQPDRHRVRERAHVAALPRRRVGAAQPRAARPR
jgi:hypothetical protein